MHDNLIKYFQGGTAIKLSNDQSDYEWARLNEVWIWDNLYEDVGTLLSKDPGIWTIDEDAEYFLRKPSLELDGWSYTPYPYPHPLTAERPHTLTVQSSPLTNIPFVIRRMP